MRITRLPLAVVCSLFIFGHQLHSTELGSAYKAPWKNVASFDSVLTLVEGEYIRLTVRVDALADLESEDVGSDLRRVLRFVSKSSNAVYRVWMTRPVDLTSRNTSQYTNRSIFLEFLPCELSCTEPPEKPVQSSDLGDFMLPVGQYDLYLESDHDPVCRVVIVSPSEVPPEVQSSYRKLLWLRANYLELKPKIDSVRAEIASIAETFACLAPDHVFRYEALDCSLFLFCELRNRSKPILERNEFERMLAAYLAETSCVFPRAIAVFDNGLGRFLPETESQSLLMEIAVESKRPGAIEGIQEIRGTRQ